MSNCILVALRLWLAVRARAYLWIRRSLHFKGLVPHLGVAFPVRRGLVVVEYIPPKSRLWTRDNFLLAFKGVFRVWRYELVEVRRFKHRDQIRALLRGDRNGDPT